MKAANQGIGRSQYRLMLVAFCVGLVATIASASVALFAAQETAALRGEQYEYQQSALLQAAMTADSRFGMAASVMRQFWSNASFDVLPYIVGGDHGPYRVFRMMRALRVNQEYLPYPGFLLSVVDPVEARCYSPWKNVPLAQALEEMGYDPARAGDILSLSTDEKLSGALYFSNHKGSLLFAQPWSNATPGHVLIECQYFDLTTLPVDMAGLAECGFTILHGRDVVFDALGEGAPDIEALLSLQKDLPLDAEGVFAAGGYQVRIIASLYHDLRFVLVSPRPVPQPWYARDRHPEVVLAFLIALGLLVAYFVSSILYRPVRAMYSRVQTLVPGGGTGRALVNEFDVVTTTLHGMQKTIQSLRQTMQDSQPSLREKLLRDLMQGMIDPTAIEGVAAELCLPQSDGMMSLTLIEVRYHKDLTISLLAELNPQIERVLMAHSAEYALEGREPIVKTVSLRRFCILSAHVQVDTLRAIAARITRGLEQSIGYETTASITIARTLQDIPNAYDRAFQMHRSAQQRGLAVHLEMDDGAPQAKLIYPVETERELIRTITDGDAATVTAQVNRIFAQNSAAHVPPKRLAAALYTTIERVMQHTDLPGAAMDEAKQALEGAADMQALHEAMGTVLQNLTRAIRSSSSDSTSTFAQAIMGYIDAHYSQDISLVQVADHFGFSSVYMSSLFKSVTGTNFKEYLTLVRVRHARALLLKGHRVQDVSEMVGCNTADTFIRMFKRVEGISPGRYQQRHLEEGEQPPER